MDHMDTTLTIFVLLIVLCTVDICSTHHHGCVVLCALSMITTSLLYASELLATAAKF
jgi:hypothetical protein